MMANRYMDTFRDEILGWNKKLMNLADVNQIMSEIQRTWAYLESLFIHSEEVKKELPEATVRFASIDKEVKEVLKTFGEIKNAVDCCNRDGLFKFLEKQQGELEICEKVWCLPWFKSALHYVYSTTVCIEASVFCEYQYQDVVCCAAPFQPSPPTVSSLKPLSPPPP